MGFRGKTDSYEKNYTVDFLLPTGVEGIKKSLIHQKAAKAEQCLSTLDSPAIQIIYIVCEKRKKLFCLLDTSFR